MIWLAVGGIFLVLYAALTLLVRGASRTLRRQNDALRERSERLLDSYRRLEESALEAVETLNATVDAKDPYTAGHSQRVQRVALAVGSELRLAPASLDALRFAGLFHDLGKLRVPDAILMKPEPLTPDEYEVIKRHPRTAPPSSGGSAACGTPFPRSGITTSAGTATATRTVSRARTSRSRRPWSASPTPGTR